MDRNEQRARGGQSLPGGMRRRLERLAASPGFASGSELSNIKMLADGAARREGRDLHNPAQQRGPRWPSAPPRCSPRAPAHRTPSPARGQGSGSSGFQFKKNLHTGCLISFSPRQGRSLREPGSEISEGRLQGQTGAPPLTWGCHRVGHTHTHTRADTPPRVCQPAQRQDRAAGAREWGVVRTRR